MYVLLPLLSVISPADSFTAKQNKNAVFLRPTIPPVGEKVQAFINHVNSPDSFFIQIVRLKLRDEAMFNAPSIAGHSRDGGFLNLHEESPTQVQTRPH
jgi:hypothetical protein